MHPLQGQADSLTDEYDTTPDVSLLMNSSTMEELIHQLTSSPISGTGLTSPSLLVDESEAVDEVKALTNFDSQLGISPSLAVEEAGTVNDVEEQQPGTSSSLAVDAVALVDDLEVQLGISPSLAVEEAGTVNDVEEQQPGTSSSPADKKNCYTQKEAKC